MQRIGILEKAAARYWRQQRQLAIIPLLTLGYPAHTFEKKNMSLVHHLPSRTRSGANFQQLVPGEWRTSKDGETLTIMSKDDGTSTEIHRHDARLFGVRVIHLMGDAGFVFKKQALMQSGVHTIIGWDLVRAVEDWAFYLCPLRGAVKLSKLNMFGLGAGAFCGTQITSVEICLNEFNLVPNRCFEKCQKLRTVRVTTTSPNSPHSPDRAFIVNGAFGGCRALESFVATGASMNIGHAFSTLEKKGRRPYGFAPPCFEKLQLTCKSVYADELPVGVPSTEIATEEVRGIFPENFKAKVRGLDGIVPGKSKIPQLTERPTEPRDLEFPDLGPDATRVEKDRREKWRNVYRECRYTPY